MNVLRTKSTGFTKVSDITIPDIFYNRLKTGVPEIDIIFGDGILPGICITLTGQAGAGKTSFCLQLLEALQYNGYTTGYASGEEDETQLAFTSKRLEITEVNIANITDVDELADSTKDLDILVVDSMQALTVKEKMNSRDQEKYIVTTLLGAAKDNECAIIFIAHRTKAGQIKGSTLVTHSVDANMEILHNKEKSSDSIIISTYKNRFGCTNDYDATMTPKGLEFLGTITEPPGNAKKEAKKSKDEDLKNQILDMDVITKAGVTETLSVSGTKAYVLLKELCDTKVLTKQGRGMSALFIR